MTKTLGCIAFDADTDAHTMPWDEPWEGLPESERSAYERMAAAVAAQVRERCAQVCERARPDGGRAWDEAQHACFDALSHVAAFIREMK